MTIETYTLNGNGRIPNSRLPLLIYRQGISGSPRDLEDMLRSNGWPPDWHSSYGLYPRHHFHSDTHELIAVTRGQLEGQFGGHDGITVALGSGDVVVIPAGVGHFGAAVSEDLRLVGAFPSGYGIHDFRLGYPDEYAMTTERARGVPIPASDPLRGANGPLSKIWNDADRGLVDAQS